MKSFHFISMMMLLLMQAFAVMTRERVIFPDDPECKSPICYCTNADPYENTCDGYYGYGFGR